MYSLIKKILFTLDPETAHGFALKSLNLAHQLGITRFFAKVEARPCTLMGLSFPNPVGLAAGYDRNADYIQALATLGFGFIEIGTVTPKPHLGNPRPRVFRLIPEEAIINRMGFANKGLDYVVRRLQTTGYKGILGINIGKNRDTPNENAVEDYLLCFRELAKFASYITINISSPNTEGLRDLQQRHALSPLLAALKREQQSLAKTQQKYVPLVVKISPDMDPLSLHELASVVLAEQIDGVIATNTTLARNGIENSAYAKEKGGLSGKPLTARSTQVIQQLKEVLQDTVPIIACGGILDERSAREKIMAGAKLVQLYTGLIYNGPKLIRRVALSIC